MKCLWIIIFCIGNLGSFAQRMQVEDFARYRRSLLHKASFETDRHFALLDFVTNEKGFLFFDGDNQIPVSEKEGLVTLALPSGITSLLIKHPDYGQLYWKIPVKRLKRNRHYHAYLNTQSFDKEFRQGYQWALFSVSPDQAIVHVDSSSYFIRDGALSLYLPVGRHSCRIESPFYKEVSCCFDLSDSARLEKEFILEPFYSYLTVETIMPKAEILLDGRHAGNGRAGTGRLMPGRYRLSVVRNDSLFYDRYVMVDSAERKVVDLSRDSLGFIGMREMVLSAPMPMPDSIAVTDNEPGMGIAPLLSDVSIKAFDDDTEIWLNREMVGKGEWHGRLAPGFYAVSSAKEGLSSHTEFFRVEPGRDEMINLVSPKADFGMLNVSCNEVNAMLYIDGLFAGLTPCVVKNLPVDRTYTVRVVKGGKSAEQDIRLKGNDMVNLRLVLRKNNLRFIK